MDACRASSCCRGARNVPWTEVPSVRGTRVVPGLEAGVVSAEARRVPGAHRRRWRLWISSPQRRPSRLNTPWTKEPSLPSTTNLNIYNTGSPPTGKNPTLFLYYCYFIVFYPGKSPASCGKILKMLELKIELLMILGSELFCFFWETEMDIGKIRFIFRKGL